MKQSKCLSEKLEHITNSDNLSNFRRYSTKNLVETQLLVDFSKAFDSIHRRKIEQIFLVFGLPKETVTEVKVRPPDRRRL